MSGARWWREQRPRSVAKRYSLAPIGGEGGGEGADSKVPADTHLTLPSLRDGTLPLPPGARRGFLLTVGYSFSSIASALDTANSPGCSTLSALTIPFSTSIA